MSVSVLFCTADGFNQFLSKAISGTQTFQGSVAIFNYPLARSGNYMATAKLTS